jgi:hypothetical protein
MRPIGNCFVLIRVVAPEGPTGCVPEAQRGRVRVVQKCFSDYPKG